MNKINPSWVFFRTFKHSCSQNRMNKYFGLFSLAYLVVASISACHLNRCKALKFYQMNLSDNLCGDLMVNKKIRLINPVFVLSLLLCNM